jgi:hypothetical protein
MPVLMIRYRAAYEGVAEVVDAIETAFAAVKAQQRAGIRYAYLRPTGTTEFVAVLEVTEGIENLLPGIEPARRLQATVVKGSWGPPRPRNHSTFSAPKASSAERQAYECSPPS